MKFGHVLLSEEMEAPKEFKGAFIQYKRLKKILKRRLAAAQSLEDKAAATKDAVEAEKEFLRLLRDQIKDVDRKFAANATAVLSHYDGLGRKKPSNPLQALLSCARFSPKLTTEALLKLQKRVFWVKKYAELNATALRKIAKKRDKLLGGVVGRCFLQACFQGQVSIHAILSLPLMRELTAVEMLLENQLAIALVAPVQQPPPKVSADATEMEMQPLQDAATAMDVQPVKDAAVQLAQPTTDADEEDPGPNYTCPICLDLLYKPVALECGHIFCARCAINIAVGHDRAIGDADRLLTTLAAYSAAYTNRQCPSCRSTSHGREGMSVFWEPRRMTHLEQLIKARFPEEHLRRQREDEEHQASLKMARKGTTILKCCCPEQTTSE